MSSSPRDFLEAANCSLNASSVEGDFRAATSRSYYAAYHEALRVICALPSPGSVAGSQGSHEQIYEQLRHPTTKSDEMNAHSLALGNVLMGLFASRIRADYRPQSDFLHREAKDAYSKAEVFFIGAKTLDAVIGASRKPKLTSTHRK